ncbi:MAG: branched-chain amino acid ABC transporter permease [Phycisphaerales bacterium]|nr:branched-chain amino acid ABC transporter permease [Phycisphaerales bacterium]MCI0629151.1 branched-chain amino acid ABC transporter permease [Phycisphaerales bacterium]MCI0676612.1 branched-chain amino acid ABC transporter permease [Phycisphaerales bacterium]
MSRWAQSRASWLKPDFVFLAVALVIPVLDLILPGFLQIGSQMRQIFLFAILGLGLNIVTGFTGLLHLGVAAFMAIGVYAFAILSSEIYPFRFGFWGALALTPVVGALAGLLLGAPTLRLRGDYLAIVTLGFGEIVQDVLRNVETVTKGTQGINPLPYPNVFGYEFVTETYQPWYFLFLGIVVLVVALNRNIENSRLGRAFISVREDELAATCMGINTVKIKLVAFALGAALCSLAGGLWASYLGSTGEPGNYDFQVSILAVCIVIVGGMGNISGVLLGALVMIGIDSLVLVQLTRYLQQQGLSSTANVMSMPNNWKYMIFGLALVLMMRFKPEGLLPSRRVKAELHHDEPPKPADRLCPNCGYPTGTSTVCTECGATVAASS